MGHAVHFLSRLERLGPKEIELALSLYRDTPLLRGVLASARIPEGAERVAIALRHEPAGPHLVVTRDGQFVTCLGPGMNVGQIPVLARGQLDARAGRIETLRERLALADTLTGPGRNTKVLFESLINAGHALSREEFLALSAFAPLMLKELLELMLKDAAAVIEDRPELAAAVARLGTARPVGGLRTQLRIFWNQLWIVGHTAALVCEHVREVADEAYADCEEPMPPLTSLHFQISFVPTALRGLMLPARIGKRALPGYKDLFRSGRSFAEGAEACTALAAIGLRHSPLRAEALKLLSNGRALDPIQFGKMLSANPDLLFGIPRRQLEEPEVWTQLGAQESIERWPGLTRNLPADSPWRLSEQPTLELMKCCIMANCNEPQNIEDDFTNLFTSTPLVANCDPESLYYPRACLDELEKARGEDWAIQQTIGLLSRYRAIYPSRPARTAATPKPNERCHCGSGRKFKRCCQQKAA